MTFKMATRIVNAKLIGLFSNETFDKRPVILIADSDFLSYNHFESQPLRNGLHRMACTAVYSKKTDASTLQHTATHYNTLQHTATHCNTLQHTATQCVAAYEPECDALKNTDANRILCETTHCNTLQHSVLQHTSQNVMQ